MAQRLCTEPVVEGMGNILLDTELVNQLMHPQITNVRNKNLSIPEQIYNITTNSRFRKGNYNLIAEYESVFLEHISHQVSSKSPIRITVPTLPFKDQNPLSTQRQVDQVDLGEFLFFRQMGDLCESVNQIYQPGIIIDLVSDGSLYQKRRCRILHHKCLYRSDQG